MITVVAFLGAAGLGALGRAEAGRRWNRPGRLSWGTLSVNVVGSFLLGLLYAVAPPLLTVLGVGALGAFTTFSSFARDVVAVVEDRGLLSAVAYAGGSCIAGVLAAAAGVALSGP